MSHHDELAAALEACLERMRAEGLSAEDALAARPELASEFNTELNTELAPLLALVGSLNELPRAPGAEAVFRASLAAALAEAPTPAGLSPPTTELVNALDEELEQPHTAVPGGSPALEAELGPLLGLAAALRTMPAAPAVDEDFRASLAQRLAEAPAPSTTARPDAGTRVIRRLWRSTAFTAALAATVILFLGAGLTYASADALPGQWLYPLKRGVEQARLWMAGESRATALHLELADRRLDEAKAVPSHARGTLPEFNREVTAALAGVDAALAGGLARDRVTDPLLRWLLGARGELVAAQRRLPPTAWRASRALLDEAILALGPGGVIGARPVPRLSDPVAVLALRAEASHPWPRRVPRRALLPPSLSPPPPPEANPPAAAAVVSLAPIGRPSDGGVPAGDAPRPTEGPAPTDPPVAPTRAPRRPTDPPSPEPTRAAPTGEPTQKPTQEPKDEPTRAPTEPPPIEPTSAPTSAPTSVPTSEPSPTARPPLPAQLELSCADEVIQTAGSTDCGIANLEAQPDLEIRWEASMGSVASRDDARYARFVDDAGMSGVDKLFVTITATARDAEGRIAEGRTQLIVVPQLELLP